MESGGKKMSKLPRIDIGLIWGKIINIWSQIGVVSGITSNIMMIGVFYTTTVYPNIKIPVWIYLLVIAIGIILLIGFILKWGISGQYRYFSKQSELTEANLKLDALLEYYGIDLESFRKQWKLNKEKNGNKRPKTC